MEQSTKGKFKIKAGIMILSMILTAQMAQSLMLTGIAASFVDKAISSVQMIFTTSSFAGILAGFVAGYFASKMNKKKLCILFEVVAISGAAIGFFFYKSFVMLFVASFLIGFGLAIVSSLTTALMVENFAGNERMGLFGAQALFIHGAGVLISIAAGYLVMIEWRYVYLVFLVLIPVGIAAWALLPNGPIEKPMEGEKVKFLNPYVISKYIQAIVLGIVFMTYYANITFSVAEAGIAASFPSVLNAIYEIAVVLIGLLLTMYVKIFKSNSSWVALLLFSASMWVFGFANTNILMMVGSTLLGLGFGSYICIILAELPEHVHPMAITKSISIYIALMSVGMFLSPYIITTSASLILSNTAASRFIMAAILITAVALIFKVIDNAIIKKESVK